MQLQETEEQRSEDCEEDYNKKKNKKERNHKRSRRLAREIMIVRTKQRLTDLKLAKMASPKALVMCLAKIAPTLILSLLDATLSSSCLIMHAIRCL